eukprot:TRINITY_DN4746_c0_g2_i11.p1 TRINITY_DN4746_c0_g2~~TRINITY_DN4746_c0_g2_i11.p1  ORF type:complete len:193 (+),score=59.91 TRINITY_DN4746_c0_g2_i11:148-726(+)
MVKKWRQELNTLKRQLDRQIRAIEREQNKVKIEIRTLSKKGEVDNAKILVKELIRSRKQVERIYVSKAQINSISMQLQQNLATYKIAGALKRSSDIMTLVNSMVKVPEMQQIMMVMAQEMEKAGLIEEIIDETLDNEESLSEEISEEVAKVFDELHLDLVSNVPTTGKTRPQKVSNLGRERGDQDLDEIIVP